MCGFSYATILLLIDDMQPQALVCGGVNVIIGFRLRTRETISCVYSCRRNSIRQNEGIKNTTLMLAVLKSDTFSYKTLQWIENGLYVLVIWKKILIIGLLELLHLLLWWCEKHGSMVS